MQRIHDSKFFLAALSLAPAALFGQFDQGQIAGTVTDPSHSAVPGAAVTAVEIHTGRKLTTTTGEKGSYALVGLRVCAYVVTVEAQGFRKFVQEGVTVDAALRTTVDAILTIGATSEVVNVTAEATPLSGETAQVGRTVESRQISDLALNGRNPIDLALTKAGVVGTVAGSGFNSFNPIDLSAAFSINGAPLYGNNITIDGVGVVRSRGDGQSAPTLTGLFNADALQEVQILTSTYPAEYGRALTGQVRLVTKSGSHDFHASAFEFFRNSALDSNTWQRNSSNTQDARTPQPLRFHQPGFTIGGPVVIPGHFNTKRDRLFFFVSEEWISYHQSVASTGIVPSLAMRDGDFSEVLSPTNTFFGRSMTVKDPLNNVPFANNVIPPSRLSPNGIGLLKAYPVPRPGFQQGVNNWYDSQPQPNNSRKDTVRIDYQQGIHRLSLSASDLSFHEDDPFRTGFDVADTRWNRPNYTAAFSVISAPSTGFINEFTGTYANDVVRMTLYPIDGVPRYERSLYGINFPYAIPGPKRVVDRIPTIAPQGFSTLDGSSKPGNSSGPMFSFRDTVTSLRRSTHSVKLGFSYELAEQINADQIAFNQNGWFTFQNTGNPITSGVAIANAALGYFNTYQEIGPAADTHVKSYAIEAFVQDTWKLNPRLTIEYGIRYSYFQPWHAIWNDISNFDARFYDPSTRPVVDPSTGGIIGGNPFDGIVEPGKGYPASAGGRALGASVPGVQALFHNLPEGFVNSYLMRCNFSPRLGIAWRLTDHTVIRTGGGTFRVREFLNNGSLFRNPPNQASANAVNGLVDNPGGGGLLLPPNIGAVSNEYLYPSSYNYSFSVQHEFPQGFVLDVSYVGDTGVNLLRIHNINQLPLNTIYLYPSINPNALRPYTGPAAINYAEQSGRSNYNSLQVTLNRRFRSGLGIDVAYTYSKVLDNTQTPYNGYHFVWAPSTIDRMQVLTFNYIYELPFFRSNRGLTGNLLGNWQISGVTAFRSGDPLSVVDSTDNAGVGPGSASQPWNLVGSTAVSGATGVGLLWFNPAAFVRPAQGTFGNAALDLLRGPKFQNWDAALFKNFRLRERLDAQFRFEVFDFLNHPNLSDPVVSPTSGSFGKILAKSDNRNLQLGLKIRF
jgi:hypothetical protein